MTPSEGAPIPEPDVAAGTPVVVGVDGSASALHAVDTAAREASLRGCPLRVVHVFIWPALHVPLGPSALGPADGGLRNLARQTVTEAVQRARAAAPEVEVTHAVVNGEALTALEAESRSARLIVVGSRGLGGFIGLLVGSTAVHLSAYSHCPLLVVREQSAQGDGRVVLGVDGSPGGRAAIDFAFAHAALHGTGILALHAWSDWSVQAPPPDDPAEPYAAEPGALAGGEQRLLAELMAGRAEHHPEVTVEHRVVKGGAREALIAASEGAALVVVGARGRGGFTGLLLGSVSQALLHHAHSPVAVVRPT
ncbi:Universal stress protein [Streptomyces sp. YIM 130001]|uniref:universal stress protein n=1 Tax=Streptomyces sp. YIM 130001 TaxID=2259644 RepID=UPI000E651810|nr:universal stress protein [Streptomyces sp. YIM 130001]RII14725.1 Universal stress protein [Streptomyces sp. YIM 130001]